jgi:hypothetical protein
MAAWIMPRVSLSHQFLAERQMPLPGAYMFSGFSRSTAANKKGAIRMQACDPIPV